MGEAYREFLNQKFLRLVARLRDSPEKVDHLPPLERQIARLAIEGRPVYEIAQRVHISDAAVWTALGWITDSFTGMPAGGAERGYETGGLGADTDPGVTGGYGDTAFGSIGNEPPEPETEEEF